VLKKRPFFTIRDPVQYVFLSLTLIFKLKHKETHTMTTVEHNRKLIQEYIHVLGQEKSEANIDKYVADPVLKGHIIVFESGLPNYQIIAKDIIAEGNKVTLRFLLEAEHKGDLFGVPATGRPVSIDGIIIYELANNKIVNHWMQVDSVALMQQIGAMPITASGH
jgi:predicted ester cyclase